MPQPRVLEVRRMPENGDRDTAGSAGGDIVLYKCGVASIKYGDVVVVSTTYDDSVATSLVATDAVKIAGVVCGGGSNAGYDSPIFDQSVVGLAINAARGTSAVIGMTLVVQSSGIAWVTADGAIARGATVGLSGTTLGRVVANATANQNIGVAMRAAAGAGSQIPILLW